VAAAGTSARLVHLAVVQVIFKWLAIVSSICEDGVRLQGPVHAC